MAKTLTTTLTLLLACAASPALQAQSIELPELLVRATGLVRQFPTMFDTSVADLDPGIPADGGALLRRIPGVSGSRMGGHGIDAIIRGQGQDRINVLIDGAYAFGGCPNRMDPPTVLLDLEADDRVVVIKGNQTVVYGGGGSAGTVLFERHTQRFADGEAPRVKLSAGVVGNSNTFESAADFSAGNAMAFARASVHHQSADNYRDGDGDLVRSAYNTEGAEFTLGYTPGDRTRAELSFSRTHDYDTLFAGAGMDSPYSDSDQWRLRLHRDAPVGVFSALRVELYRVEVDHLMDNFSLRVQTAPRKLRVPTESNTYGGRVVADFQSGSANGTVGVDYIEVARDATRFWDFMSSVVDQPNSYLWPDVSRSSLGLFGEVQIGLTERATLTAGLRYDHARAAISQSRANMQPVGPAWAKSPNELYEMYYGRRSSDRDDGNLGGLLRYAYELGDGLVATAGISRSVREADATERYIAANNGVAELRWIGRPDLDPEVHHQIDVTLAKRAARWDAEIDLFYDRVDDFILRDRARGQAGILQNDGATVYRNVDATFWGGELYGTYQVSDRLSAGASVAYVYAQNRTDDRAVAQIPPLNGALNLDYAHGDRAGMGARITWAATQTRVDDDPGTGSGLDVGETAGWWVLDLYGRFEFAAGVDLRFGVDNLFDRTYAYHVNRANLDPFNPQVVQVNEPGRSIWARLAVDF